MIMFTLKESLVYIDYFLVAQHMLSGPGNINSGLFVEFNFCIRACNI